jgi:DNA adenine methylase
VKEILPLPRKTSASYLPVPFVKWAGGKRKLTPLLIKTFPQDFNPEKNRYFEPFIGGGALMFALGIENGPIHVPGNALFINDMNPELTNTYEVLRDKVTLLVRELELLSESIDEETFYQIRANVPRGKVARAARFIYLNKTCFNGLWRVNSKGEFNVPFAKYKNPTLFVEENLRACSKRLKNSTITTTTFQKAVSKTRKGDLVYFDPPYIPLSESASFASYSKEGFNLKDQEELARCIRLLTDKGVRVLLSNSDTPLSRKIFGFLDLRLITVQRSVGAHASTRIKVDELIGTNY